MIEGIATKKRKIHKKILFRAFCAFLWPIVLHQFQLRQILRINQTDRFPLCVHHNQIIDVSFVENFQRLGGQCVITNADWIFCHHAFEWLGK